MANPPAKRILSPRGRAVLIAFLAIVSACLGSIAIMRTAIVVRARERHAAWDGPLAVRSGTFHIAAGDSAETVVRKLTSAGFGQSTSSADAVMSTRASSLGIFTFRDFVIVTMREGGAAEFEWGGSTGGWSEHVRVTLAAR